MRGSGVDYEASSEGHTWPNGRAAVERNRKEDFSKTYEAMREAMSAAKATKLANRVS